MCVYVFLFVCVRVCVCVCVCVCVMCVILGETDYLLFHVRLSGKGWTPKQEFVKMFLSKGTSCSHCCLRSGCYWTRFKVSLLLLVPALMVSSKEWEC